MEWFDAHKRELPWRRTRDPYRIWLAEIMLQQTRVPAAIPYYQRFLRAFPTVERLVRAPLDRVLRYWAGLGYYQRARNLHAAAKKIVNAHGGRFPRTLEAALALPGVGPYTARAVLSIAYQRPLAVVDGNVTRALIRLFYLSDANPNDRAALQPLADRLLARDRPGDFNQALMELGSTLCLPRIPRCAECPLEEICAARRAGVERKLPERRPHRRRPQVKLSVVVLRRQGKVLLNRETGGYFSGLWHFPYSVGRRPDELARRLGGSATRLLLTFTHQTTMRDLLLRVYEARADGALGAPMKHRRWVSPAALARLGIGAATRKIAALLEKAGAKG